MDVDHPVFKAFFFGLMFNLARIAVQRGRHGSLATIKTGLASTKFQLLHPRFQTTGGTAGNTFKTGQFHTNTGRALATGLALAVAAAGSYASCSPRPRDFGARTNYTAPMGPTGTDIGSSLNRSTLFDYTDLDHLYDESKFKDTLDALEAIDENVRDYHWQWRTARTKYNVSDNDSTMSAKEKKKLVGEAFDLICKAKKINPDDNDVQRWYGILLNEHSALIGLKEKIKNLLDVKKAWERAVQLNSKDATAYHLLGCWEAGLQGTDWISRNIAKTFFGTLPDSSYERAYDYFRSAEDTDPLFYLANKLKLAEMCLKLDKKEEARQHLTEALAMEVKNEDDERSLKEVQALLKKHKWVVKKH